MYRFQGDYKSKVVMYVIYKCIYNTVIQRKSWNYFCKHILYLKMMIQYTTNIALFQATHPFLWCSSIIYGSICTCKGIISHRNQGFCCTAPWHLVPCRLSKKPSIQGLWLHPRSEWFSSVFWWCKKPRVPTKTDPTKTCQKNIKRTMGFHEILFLQMKVGCN